LTGAGSSLFGKSGSGFGCIQIQVSDNQKLKKITSYKNFKFFEKNALFFFLSLLESLLNVSFRRSLQPPKENI
jgi:hypothetical protein